LINPDRQKTDRQTDAGENITSLVQVVSPALDNVYAPSTVFDHETRRRKRRCRRK